MPFRRLLAALPLAFALAAIGATPGLACAVATSIRVENQGRLPVRSITVSDHVPGRVSESSAGPNQLPPAGLAPGQATTIVLPSCIGIYTVNAVFADGRVVTHPALNAASIRGLALR